MRIAILASGSRGDVQPYVALGKSLHDAGHDVRLISPQNYAGLAQAAGVAFHPTRGDVQAVADSEEMRALIEKGDFHRHHALSGASLEEDGGADRSRHAGRLRRH